MDVQAGLALYWWQRLVTIAASRRRVNDVVAVVLLSYLCRFQNKI